MTNTANLGILGIFTKFKNQLNIEWKWKNVYFLSIMGANPQPILKAKSQNVLPFKPSPLKSSPVSTKIVMKKVQPLVIEDEAIIEQDQHDVIHSQASKQLNEEEYQMMEENVEEAKEAVEIKVKWNSFIKTKQKNYLDDYTIIREIGRGGYGKVNKVISKYTGIYRAAKKIKKAGLAKEDREKLFSEMAIMQSLDHANITKLFQVYDYKAHYVLILQLCEGGELFKKILVSNTLTENYIANIIRQILKVLLYLKHKGIIHRDLKPQNMLFQKGSLNLKIIDFGIAIQKNGSSHLSQRVGTPYYIAPEVLLKDYDEKCDIWSTGVIMYMMMTKRPPFRGNDEQQVMQNILSLEPTFNYEIKKKYSPQCINFVKSLLAKNPAERLSVEDAYHHPWIKTAHSCLKVVENEKDVIQSIGTFKFKNKLEAVVHTFIVSQLMTSEQKALFTTIFQELDHNHDGVISKLELQSALRAKSSIPEGRMSLLMRVIDTNSSGYIDLTEFIVAGLKIKDFFSKEHFEQAFSYFDIDHSGSISYDQIAFFLDDSTPSEQSIKKIFQQVDQNNDGVISRDEFVHLLMRNNRKKYQQQVNRN